MTKVKAIRIHEEDYRKTKIESAKTGLSIKEIIRQALQLYFKKK